MHQIQSTHLRKAAIHKGQNGVQNSNSYASLHGHLSVSHFAPV